MWMMIPNKIISFFLIIILIISSQYISNANADSYFEDNIDTIFDIEILSGTNLNIKINANVKKIMLDASGTSYNKNDIIKISENNSEIMGAIKYAIKNAITNQIKEIFIKSDIHSLNELPFFDNGIFYDEYIINLSPSFFNFENEVLVSDFINGILDLGGVVNYSFNLISEIGWNSTFNFILPPSIGYYRTTGIVNDNIIQWEITNNGNGNLSKIAEISLKYNNPTSSIQNEEIELEFELNCDYNSDPSLNMSIITNSIDISKYDIVPEFITNLRYIPSDGIRLFIKNYFLTWDVFFNTSIKYFLNEISPKIENSSFNQTLDFIFQWYLNSTLNCSNPFDINNMDNTPPIKAIFSDNSIDLLIHEISSNAFFGIINSGGKSHISSTDINFGNDFETIGYNYKIILNLPDNINIDNENIYSWNESKISIGNVTSNISDEYSREEIDTIIEMNFQTTDLNILSLFTGDTKLTFNLFLTEIQNRNITQIPEYLNIPEKIDLKYFNSDVFRLCIDEKIFDNQSINKFLLSEVELFKNRFENILSESDIKAILDKKIFEESLIWDKDISKMGNDFPIKISSYSNIAYSVPFTFNLFPPSLNINEQSFSFSGINNCSVKYKINFPKGIKVEIINQSDRINIEKTENDEYFVEIYFNNNESQISEIINLSIKPSFVFLISLFIPCIISLIIAIILLFIVFILKRKRIKNKGIASKNHKHIDDTYQNEEYYVPPPPSKK